MGKTIIVEVGGVQTEYKSQSDAARKLGVNQSVMSRLCRGVLDSHKGVKAWFKPEVEGEQPQST